MIAKNYLVHNFVKFDKGQCKNKNKYRKLNSLKAYMMFKDSLSINNSQIVCLNNWFRDYYRKHFEVNMLHLIERVIE